jgi:hypothetical protein
MAGRRRGGRAELSLAEPLPPRRVVLATGPEGGAYAAVGRRDQEIFAAIASGSS